MTHSDSRQHITRRRSRSDGARHDSMRLVRCSAGVVRVRRRRRGGRSLAQAGREERRVAAPTAATSGNTRYSPLDQINAIELQQARSRVAVQDRRARTAARVPVRIDAADGRTASSTPPPAPGARSSRSTPAPASCSGCTARHEGARGAAAPRQLSGRGLAYWTDGREERILYVTPGYRLIALDAKTGDVDPGFGKNGAVDLKTGRRSADRSAEHARSACTPRRSIAKNVVIVGAAHRVRRRADGQDQRERLRARVRRAAPASGCGSSTRFRRRASSATTPGRRTRGPTPATPACGRRSASTRSSASPTCRSNCRPATTSARIARATASSARASSPSICRPASGSGTTSWCTTGSGTWTFRARRSSRIIVVNGRPVKALAQPTKQAFMYVFDRETGQPVWPIEERPVAKGDVPGEWYSPTQPFPLDAHGKPFNYDRQGFVDRRPDRLHAGAARRSDADRCRSTSSDRCSRRRS